MCGTIGAVLAGIPEGSSVMTNTSVTLAETGIADAINDGSGQPVAFIAMSRQRPCDSRWPRRCGQRAFVTIVQPSVLRGVLGTLAWPGPGRRRRAGRSPTAKPPPRSVALTRPSLPEVAAAKLN
jgi:hypothetical protein